MRALLASLTALLLLSSTVIAADDRARRIDSDAELRRLFAHDNAAAIDALRLDRFAGRIGLRLDRARVRADTLRLAAEHELGHAERDLNTLKTRAPDHPSIPLLERELSRTKRQIR